MDGVHGIVCSPQTPCRNTRVFFCFLLSPAKTNGNGYMTAKQTFLLLLSAQDSGNRRKLYWPVVNLWLGIRVIIGPDVFNRTHIAFEGCKIWLNSGRQENFSKKVGRLIKQSRNNDPCNCRKRRNSTPTADQPNTPPHSTSGNYPAVLGDENLYESSIEAQKP